MADRYRNFADLAENKALGTDFQIRVKHRATTCVVIAPHGGFIEPHTSEIAEAIAGGDLSFYAFEALKSGAHGDLHITSHHFDEPQATALVEGCQSAIAIHGRRDDDSDTVWLGGRATVLRDAIGASLRAAGFEAAVNEKLPGLHRTNICNRTLRSQGVQLELPRSLRHSLTRDPDDLRTFCDAIRDAIARALDE